MTKLAIVIVLGCFLATIGVIGGATNTLSGDVPLILAGFGAGSAYLSIALMGIVHLWRMDQ